MIIDKRFRTDGRKARVLHVPLTDDEFDRLRDVAHVQRETIGNVVSGAVRARIARGTRGVPLTPAKGKR